MSQRQNSGLHRDALGTLFKESRLALRRYVARLISSRESADDIVQEAFLRVFENAKDVQTPRAYLFSTARNLASDVRRQQRARKTDLLGDFDVSGVVEGEVSPEGKLLAQEEAELLKQAVLRLPPQRQAVFVLRVFHACSYKEIALRLGLAPKTVENHIALALRETHEYLQSRTRYERTEHG